ncbi:Ion channel [Roseateles aquatilis]|uniref:Ion channel n=1 Tax=Roseateles aquatilis TaxID=431061 RepID=A0A246JMH0_9BURK|nr:ion channel [Roseateles aquatilis]OWQ93821.1 Ion channel [Roseateles aquatilis]
MGPLRYFRYLRYLALTRRHPSAILLLVQLAGLLLYPLFESSRSAPLALGAFGIVVLIFTTRMVRSTPGLTWLSATIALPAVVLLLLQGVWGMPWLLPWSAALEALFYFYAAGSLIAYMMSDWHATTDELFAAGATFTLLAWAFAYVFVVVQALYPGSFSAAVNPQDPRTWTELVFLSFALLSSTGIGDVIPVKPLARAVTTIEMFVGVMYVAVVVSRLIGLTLLQHETRKELD